MSFRGPTGKFFFDWSHDVFLYYQYLERVMWDEAKDDMMLDWRGNQVLDGGWSSIAESMSARFGRAFSAGNCRDRLERISNRGEYFAKLFDEVMWLQDALKFRKLSAEWFGRAP